MKMVENADPIGAASEVYAGRAFSLAKISAREASADLAIISAGLGLVLSSRLIPSYDLTFSRGGIGAIVHGAFSKERWWQAISTGPYSTSFHDMVKGKSSVLICLSASYSACLSDAIEEIASEISVRIFGAGLSKVLQPSLQKFVLPYDSRLDVKFCAGTQTDFAQRALLHYVSKVKPRRLRSLNDERTAILDELDDVPIRSPRPKRRQLDDDEMRQLICRLIPIVGRKHSPMLRHVRDNEQVACEQGRFARLFNEVIRD